MAIESWIAPGGWSLRSFRLAARGLPKGELLFLGGRGDFLEKYLEAFEVWQSAGWNVSGFDWRGQGGSGRLHPRDACHVDDFGTFIADLEAYCLEWHLNSSGPHVAIGHSMGGHVLLRAAMSERIALDGLVLLSPMLGIRAGPLSSKTMRRVALIGRSPPLRRRPIWSGTRSPNPNAVTSCPERQADKLWWKTTRPELGRSGPTWGWLAAATQSIAELEQTLRTHQLKIPGLILAASNDPIVDPQAIVRAARRLPTFDYRVIHRAGHELLRERDEPRMECVRHIELFLDRVSSKQPAADPANN